jgi:hypothetical protein
MACSMEVCGPSVLAAELIIQYDDFVGSSNDTGISRIVRTYLVVLDN